VRRDSACLLDAQNSSLGHKTRSSSTSLSSFLKSYFSFLQCRSKLSSILIKTRNQLLASASAGTFYKVLNQPEWAPPAWLFAPAWTVLYFLMALSVWIIWRSFGFQRARIALSLFVSQLVLNALWSWLFFVWHQGALAFYEIIVLWGFILGTIISFWRLNRVAGMLLLPYLAWVTFAAVLAFTLWQLNPMLLT